MQTFLYVQGTRVKIRRGTFPMDPGLVGRTGTVVETDMYRPKHYAVQMDGESALRDFTEDELEALTEGKPIGLAGSLGPGVGGGA